MRLFTKISPTLWRSEKFKTLETLETKFLHLYLLTCPHQNSSGCFHLPLEYACKDLDWSLDQLKHALMGLVSAKLISYDEKNECLFIEGWFKFNLPDNPNHAKSMYEHLEQVPSKTLIGRCYEDEAMEHERRDNLRTQKEESKKRSDMYRSKNRGGRLETPHLKKIK